MTLSEKLVDLKISSPVDSMLDRIIDSDSVFYRSEQRGTADLTNKEKKVLLHDMYNDRPSLFLSRYYMHMIMEDCQCFDLSTYENAHYAKLISERSSLSKAKVLVRNRRYSELVRLKRDTDYFSNKKMREREPELFDTMVGRFLPEEEQEHLRPNVRDETLSTILMRSIDSYSSLNSRKTEANILDDLEPPQFKNDELLWGSNFVKHVGSRFQDSIDLDEEPDEPDANEPEASIVQLDTENTSNDLPYLLSTSDEDSDKAQLEDDFIDYMEQRFLQGRDAEFFDYEALDNSTYSREFERMRNLDLEDAYFDSD